MEHPAYGLLRPVTETASVLLCDNPGRMTLDGTNTWVPVSYTHLTLPTKA